jgi:two-component sensor histidine kinase
LYDRLAVSKSAQTGLPQALFAPGEPHWIEDIAADDPLAQSPEGEDLGIRAAFGFPIVTNGEVVAVLEFFSPIPVAPDHNLLLTARTMGDQVGRVIERRRVQEHQALLLAELDHRARNMLAVVMAMAAQTARATTSIDGFKTNFFARLNAFSRAYGLLTAKNWRPTGLEALVLAVAEPHLVGDRSRLAINGPPVMLPPKTALAMSMILHELLTNAAKYGALSTKTGVISLTSRLQDGQTGKVVSLDWRESGAPGLTAPITAGFGTKLIETSIRHELGGNVTRTYGPDGVAYVFEFPQPE